MIKKRYNFKEGRLIPRKKHYKPFRFVGIGIIVMVVLLFILYKIIVG
ncbi:MAG: hypothetical protein ACTSQ8_12805 [Candidatus Helarchaeota archaeon]